MLARDAKKLEAFHPAANKKIVDKTGRDGDDFASCSNNDTALRFYQLSGDFGEGGELTPAKRADSFALPLRDELKKTATKSIAMPAGRSPAGALSYYANRTLALLSSFSYRLPSRT